MRHIPNLLSGFRILLIPFFVLQMIRGNLTAAALILVASGLTDLLDGWLARRFGWVSQLGKILDPAADKLTQVTVCVVLAIQLPQFWYFFAFLLLKDALMLVLGGQLVRKGIHLEGARWFGKVVTTLFYVFMVALLLLQKWTHIPSWIEIAMLSIISLGALFAGLMYIPQYRTYRSQGKELPAKKMKEVLASANERDKTAAKHK